MRTALAIISVIVLALHGFIFYEQLSARWQEHQSQYFAEAAQRADNPAVRAALTGRKPAIEQVIVRSFGSPRVDRCMTCHIAVDDPRFARADQPLRTHPPIPGHKFETFGCTICHDGQAREVADVTILGGDLSRLPWLVDLGHRTLRTARLNLTWAFLYNGIGLGLAVSGRLHPLFGAVGMVASSLLVVLHSQRLARVPLPGGDA